MAIEAERLLAVFEARFSSLEKALTKARSDATKSFGAIEGAGTRAEKTLASIGSRGVPGMSKLNNALGRTRFETANVAAQFNDIGVQLASGQSPFLIAMQQGTQLNQILGGAGLRGSVSLLGGAFASLINPVSLATIAIIGAGGFAIQYFASILTEGEKSAETLKKQADLIRQVAERWGEAVPALQAYVDELDRVKEQADALAAGKTVRENLFEPLKEAAGELNVEMVDFVSQLQQAGVGQHVIDELQDAFVNLREEVEANTADAADTDRAQAALNTTMSLGIGDASALSEALSTLSAILADVAKQAADADQQISGVIDRGGIGVSPFGGGRGSDPRDLVDDEYWRNRYFPDPEDPARKARTRGPAISAAEREAEAVRNLIADLEFERSVIGLTNVEREKAVALRKAETAATPEQKAQIASLVEGIHAEREAIRLQEEAYERLQQVGETALNGLATAMADGKIEGRELLSVLVSVAQQLMSMKNIGGSGGDFWSFLFGSLFGSDFAGGSGPAAGSFRASQTIPGFASGTDSAPGGLAWVGERGKELVNLPRGSQVIPNHRLGGGSQITVGGPVFNMDLRGAQQGVGAEVEQAVRRATKDMTPMVVKALREIKVKGIRV